MALFLTEWDLVKIKNFDEKSLADIRTVLAFWNLALSEKSQPKSFTALNRINDTSSIRSLGLTPRTQNCLLRAHIREIGDLTSLNESQVAVIGLGYVGLPLIIRFAEEGNKSVGFDIDEGWQIPVIEQWLREHGFTNGRV